MKQTTPISVAQHWLSRANACVNQALATPNHAMRDLALTSAMRHLERVRIAQNCLVTGRPVPTDLAEFTEEDIRA